MQAWLDTRLSALFGAPAFQQTQRCGTTALFATDADKGEETAAGLAWLLVWTTLVWCVIWYAAVWVAARLVHRLPPSSVDRENSVFFVGQKLSAWLKALVVSALAMAGLLGLRGRSVEAFFDGYPVPEVAGVIFTAFEFADLALCSLHGLMTREYVLHHAIHITLGLLIRGNCFPALHACVLMAQETSGLPLQYFLAMRNRAKSHWSVSASFALFALAFFGCRLLLGTYGTVHFVALYRQHLPRRVPVWQADVMAALLVLGSAMQWWWGWVIVQNVLRRFRKKTS